MKWEIKWGVGTGLALAVIVFLGIMAYRSEKDERANRAREHEEFKAWLWAEKQREGDKERQRIADRKQPLMEMPVEKRNRKCQASPDMCLLVGMLDDDVFEMLGYPDDKNTSTFSAAGGLHRSEQWVYELWDYEATYVYFMDGRVTGWQR